VGDVFPRLRRGAAGYAGRIAAVGLTLAVVAGWVTAGWPPHQWVRAPSRRWWHRPSWCFMGSSTPSSMCCQPAGPEQVRVPYTLVTYRVEHVFVG
jgi:hypothetical protein